MFTKLAQVRERYLALRRQLEDGSVYADPALAARLLKEEMEAAARLKVPLVADVSWGDNWYDAKK